MRRLEFKGLEFKWLGLEDLEFNRDPAWREGSTPIICGDVSSSLFDVNTGADMDLYISDEPPPHEEYARARYNYSFGSVFVEGNHLPFTMYLRLKESIDEVWFPDGVSRYRGETQHLYFWIEQEESC